MEVSLYICLYQTMVYLAFDLCFALPSAGALVKCWPNILRVQGANLMGCRLLPPYIGFNSTKLLTVILSSS